MKAWVLSGFQKELIFNKVRQMKADLHKQQQCIECMSVQIAILQEELQKMKQKSAEMITLDEFHDMVWRIS